MDNNQSYQILLAEIQKSFSKKSVMVDTLADILRIEKGAVYRRLRKEVPFTFNEIVIIAKKLNISLDRLVGIKGQKTVPYQLGLPDYISPQEEDYHIFNNYLRFLRLVSQMENSETACVSNLLTMDFISGFYNLARFYLFEWNFHYHNDKIKPFHHISILPKIGKFLTETAMEMRKFSKNQYIFDSKVVKYFVNDVNYFYSIRLIEKEDVLKIKEDLFSMLDYLEDMAITGQFKETGKSVSLYVSDIEITTSYIYVEAKNIYYSFVRTFVLSYFTSTDENTFEKTKKWINSIIKISTLITLTNERQRVLFFENQRKFVSELCP